MNQADWIRTTTREQVIPRPRVTDAIGYALQCAFDLPEHLPEEWKGLLWRLDQPVTC